MKVFLLNHNPAVSRLIKLSLEKIGYELEEIASLTQIASRCADLFICDSELIDENVDYTVYGKELLFLIPRNYEKKVGKNMLEKPFLPTDFIECVKKIISKNTSSKSEQSQNVKDEKLDKLIKGGFSDLKDSQPKSTDDFNEISDIDSFLDKAENIEGTNVDVIMPDLDSIDEEPQLDTAPKQKELAQTIADEASQEAKKEQESSSDDLKLDDDASKETLKADESLADESVTKSKPDEALGSDAKIEESSDELEQASSGEIMPEDSSPVELAASKEESSNSAQVDENAVSEMGEFLSSDDIVPTQDLSKLQEDGESLDDDIDVQIDNLNEIKNKEKEIELTELSSMVDEIDGLDEIKEEKEDDDTADKLFDTSSVGDELADVDSISGFVPNDTPSRPGTDLDEHIDENESFGDLDSLQSKDDFGAESSDINEEVKEEASEIKEIDIPEQEKSTKDLDDIAQTTKEQEASKPALDETPEELAEDKSSSLDVSDEIIQDENKQAPKSRLDKAALEELLEDDLLEDESIQEESTDESIQEDIAKEPSEQSEQAEQSQIAIQSEPDLQVEKEPADEIAIIQDDVKEESTDESIQEIVKKEPSEQSEPDLQDEIKEASKDEQAVQDEALASNIGADSGDDFLALDESDLASALGESVPEQAPSKPQNSTNDVDELDAAADIYEKAANVDELDAAADIYEKAANEDELDAAADIYEKAANEDELDAAADIYEKAAKKAEQELDEKALNEAKDEISSKITETLGATLANSKFKEALKGMNIKINISFEDK